MATRLALLLCMCFASSACVPKLMFERHGQTWRLTQKSIDVYEKAATEAPAGASASQQKARCKHFLRYRRLFRAARHDSESLIQIAERDAKKACRESKRLEARDREHARLEAEALRLREVERKRQEDERRAREKEKAEQERREQERLQRLRQTCTALASQGSFEEILAAEFQGELQDIGVQRLAPALRICASENEFELRRCEELKAQEQKRLRQSIHLVALTLEAEEYDFEKREFQVALPKDGWLLCASSLVSVACEVTIGDATPMWVPLKIDDLAKAEEVRTEGLVAFMLLENDGFKNRRPVVPSFADSFLLTRPTIRPGSPFRLRGVWILKSDTREPVLVNPPSVSIDADVAQECLGATESPGLRDLLNIRAHWHREIEGTGDSQDN